MRDVPEFWRRPFRVIQFDLRLSDMRALDPRRLARQVIEYGANALLVDAGGVVAWHPSDLPHHPVNERVQGDYFGAVLREAHRQGLKVLAQVDVGVGREEHPEWLQVNSQGEVRRSGGMPLACFQNPHWRQRNCSLVDEITSRYAVDGVHLTGLRYGHCVCDLCREAFREETGLALPLREDRDDPAWRRFVRYRYDQMIEYVGRLRTFIHKRNPRAIFAVGFSATSDDPRCLCEAGWLAPRIAEMVDVITLEAVGPLERPGSRYSYWAGEGARMARGFGQSQPTCAILTYSENLGDRCTARPPAQLVYDLMQIAAHGGQPCVTLPGTFDQDDRRALPAIRQVYHYLRDSAPSYEDLRSPARVGLLYSQTTMDICGREDAQDRSLAEYRGFYEALVESHVQFDVLHDVCLDAANLSDYELVILPDVMALSDEQAAILDAYVSAGGHLIATYETGLRDDEGLERGVCSLACLGRRIVERLKGAEGILRIMDREVLSGFGDTDIIATNEGFWVTTPADDASLQITDLYLISSVRGDGFQCADRDEGSQTPGLVLNPHGAGEAAYLPWPVGESYHSHGSPEYKQLILDLVRRWVPPLLITDAPGSVQVTLHHPRGDRDVALLHLLNATGWQSKPLTEVLPVYDVSVWVQGPYSTARELVSGRDLEVTQEHGGARFAMLRLGSFAAIELVTAGRDFSAHRDGT